MARQHNHETWSLERLKECRAWVIGGSLERATTKAYASAFLLYTTFCQQHHFPIQPTPDTLSFYIVYMSHYIQPQSVKSYLSGICSKLELNWPEVREIRSSCIVTRTLDGCIKLLSQPAHHKRALSEMDLSVALRSIPPSPSHDDLLFIGIMFTGWYCLLCLGELISPNDHSLRDFRKAIQHRSIKFASTPHPHAAFFLPMHKADHLWEGSSIVLEQHLGLLDPLPIFKSYLKSRDTLFPHLPDLWLTKAGKIPTRSWFIAKLRALFPSDDVAGHSLCSGGATALAFAGTPMERIQMSGLWSSQAFLTYLRQKPILLQGSLSGHSAFERPRAPI